VQRGYHVHAVEGSARAAGALELRLAEVGGKALVLRQDPCELNAPFRYAAALWPAGFERIAPRPRAIAALTRIRAHLVDPGILLLELQSPDERLQKLAAPLVEVDSVELDDGTRIHMRREISVSMDTRAISMSCRYVHRRGATRLAEETETMRSTWYAREEIEPLVSAAGFRGATIQDAASASSGRCYVVQAHV